MKEIIIVDGKQYVKIVEDIRKIGYINDFYNNHILFNGEWYKKKEHPPKEYEILSFRNNYSYLEHVAFTTLRSNGEYLNDSSNPEKLGIYSLEMVLKNPDWHIYSVKRLSDGEIFEIGDMIYHSNCRPEKTKIIGIDLESFGIMFQTDTQFGISLQYAKKLEKLFTSTDGVDVYERDEFYWIWKNLTSIDLEGKEFVTTRPIVATKQHRGNPNPNILRFSSKENALKYIEEKKPKFEFKCEDGIVTDGERRIYGVCIVNPNYQLNAPLARQIKKSREEFYGHKENTWKFFTTTEARDKYIDYHQPKYSKKDIEELLNEPFGQGTFHRDEYRMKILTKIGL